MLLVYFGVSEADMPDPVIEVAAKSEQNDIFMVRWKYGDFHNVTIYPEIFPGNAKYYLNEPLRWRARALAGRGRICATPGVFFASFAAVWVICRYG